MCFVLRGSGRCGEGTDPRTHKLVHPDRLHRSSRRRSGGRLRMQLILKRRKKKQSLRRPAMTPGVASSTASGAASTRTSDGSAIRMPSTRDTDTIRNRDGTTSRSASPRSRIAGSFISGCLVASLMKPGVGKESYELERNAGFRSSLPAPESTTEGANAKNSTRQARAGLSS